MKKYLRFNRCLCVLLALCMVLQYVPASVLAETSDIIPPTTTIDGGTYYQLGDADDLYAFAAIVNGTHDTVEQNSYAFAILTADIVVNENVLAEDGSLNEGTYRTWTPIGRESTVFKGKFDGDGHTISGLYYNNSANDDVGLFGYVGSSSEIQNVGVVDSYFQGRNDVGGIVGYDYYSCDVTNCYNAGTIIGNSHVGGIMGYAYSSTVTECYNQGLVSGSSYTGGVVGNSYKSKLTDCSNVCDVSGSGNYIGGIVGDNDESTLTSCHNEGTVSGNKYVGSLAGYNDAGSIATGSNYGYISGSEHVGGLVGYNSGLVDSSYNDGNVSGSLYKIGGIAGGNAGTVENCHNKGNINADDDAAGVVASNTGDVINCYNEGAVTGANVGGVVYSNSGTVTNCYNAGEISGEYSVGGVVCTNDGTVTYCHNTGVVCDGVQEVGGVVAHNKPSAVVSCCYNTGTVNGGGSVGGVVGFNASAVENCYHAGSVAGKSSAGGVVGHCEMIITGEDDVNPSVTNCYSIGEISGTNGMTEITSCDDRTLVTNCYYLGTAESDSLDGTAFKTAEQFASGEVAYLLGEPWGQTIGTDEAPLLGDEMVYRNQTGGCTEDSFTYAYSNTEEEPMIIHRYQEEITPPTCTDAGFTTCTCSACGAVYIDNQTEALGHDYVDQICTRCGDDLSAAERQCGDYVYWRLEEDGTLTIYGSGDMYDFDCEDIPWYDYRDQIKAVRMEDTISSIGNAAFAHCPNLTSVEIPGSIKRIGWMAFSGSAITSVYLPFNTTDVHPTAFGALWEGRGDWACGTCDQLTEIVVDPYNPAYTSDEYGVLFNKDMTELIRCPGGFSGAYTVPESVVAIGDTAFNWCKGLTEVTLHENITSIGMDVFNGCTSLEKAVLPRGLTMIPAALFANCASLTEVVIPGSVEMIESYAFYECTSLERVIFCGTSAQWAALDYDPSNTSLNDEIVQYHHYEDNVCIYCGTSDSWDARNVTTGVYYATVQKALDEAAEGDCVQLMRVCAQARMMVLPGVTLDLNGYSLTADYVVAFDGAHVIDDAGGGRLNIGMKNLVLNEGNTMVPVYDGEGYVFTKAGFATRLDSTYTGEGVKINALACPVNMDVVELLKDGGEDNHIQIVIRLSWDTPDGTGSQEFVFTDHVVGSVYYSSDGTFSGYSRMFSMVITGFEDIENLRANVVIVSGTNVRYCSSDSISIT